LSKFLKQKIKVSDSRNEAKQKEPHVWFVPNLYLGMYIMCKYFMHALVRRIKVLGGRLIFRSAIESCYLVRGKIRKKLKLWAKNFLQETPADNMW